jgi:hypothetical protein
VKERPSAPYEPPAVSFLGNLREIVCKKSFAGPDPSVIHPKQGK